jgi:exonuclease III
MNHSSYTNQSLSIILFNANGLKNHVNELKSVLYDKRINIALITETHFTKYSYISIPGYILLKSNHPDGTAHGGVAILIKAKRNSNNSYVFSDFDIAELFKTHLHETFQSWHIHTPTD